MNPRSSHKRVLIVEAAPMFKSVLTELARCAYPNLGEVRAIGTDAMLHEECHPDVVIRMLSGSVDDHVNGLLEAASAFPHARGIYFTEIDPSLLDGQYDADRVLVISRNLQFANIINAIAEFEHCPATTIASSAELNEHQSPIKFPGAEKPMTKKQVAVMECAAQGLTVKETAREMLLSPDTVKAHMKQACERLKARNKAHAICNYIEAKRLATRSALIEE